jgi:hypothetical protein
MRSVVVLLGILLSFSLANQTVKACTCAGTRSTCESYGSANAVFVGTVVGVRVNKSQKSNERAEEIDWTPVAFKFVVEQPYLGVAGIQVEVFTGRGGGDCGYNFQVGQRYLVYANAYQNKLSTGICSRTKLYSSATEDLAFLSTLSSATPGISIEGGLTHRDADGETFGSDLLVTIQGESVRKEIRPDAAGRFRISGLPAGSYKLNLQLPETLTTSQPEREITVADKGCALVGWFVTDNGRVLGRVVNADGEPVANITVSLVTPSEGPKVESVTSRFVVAGRTDDDGNFTLSAVPGGRYLLAINYRSYPDPKDPNNAYPRLFYPSVTDEAQAQMIIIRAGEKVEKLEVRIPSKRSGKGDND